MTPYFKLMKLSTFTKSSSLINVRALYDGSALMREARQKSKLKPPPKPCRHFRHIAVSGYLYSYPGVRDQDCYIYGLNSNDAANLKAIMSCFEFLDIDDVLLKTKTLSAMVSPLIVLNHLGELGYRVISSTDNGKMTWTLTREEK